VKRTSCFGAIILLDFSIAINSFAAPISFQNSPSFSTENLQKTMKWFTAEPHPMGSNAQSKLALELRQTLKQFGWETKALKFKTNSPNYESDQFGGKQKNAKPTISVTGINIIAKRKGKSNCSIIIGGHFDTKYFKDFRFIGANDGGSSTILMLEFARVIMKKKFKENSIGSCNIILTFFDGEEAFLQDWNEGEKSLGIQDNLYGSREFAKKIITINNGKSFYENVPINLIMVLDMIGHKNQDLSITRGSDEHLAKILIESSYKIKISKANFMIEDDHTPFLSTKVPILHIIDWKNLNEWHTMNDTSDIISYQAIANLGETLIQFLSSNRI
jgi:glutaminyl-peptide cyclotransferase